MSENQNFMEKLTKVNNDLVNLQRQYAKSNANLKKTTNELKETNEELEAFISMVSHELRTPLTSFNLSLSLLKNHKDKLTKEKSEKIFDIMQRNVDIMAKLIDNLLLISKINSGKLKLEKEVLNLSIILNNLKNEFGASLEVKNICLKIDNEIKTQFIGDFFRIEQVLRILIDNSIKYSQPNSTIEIVIKTNYQGKENPENIQGFLIKVTDQGIGICDTNLKNIFQKFYRADNASHIKGTGLGLSIAKQLVLLHNGTISVESQLSKGTTFKIFLPY